AAQIRFLGARPARSDPATPRSGTSAGGRPGLPACRSPVRRRGRRGPPPGRRARTPYSYLLRDVGPGDRCGPGGGGADGRAAGLVEGAGRTRGRVLPEG